VIYNVLGQKIKNLSDKFFMPGVNSVRWDAKTDNGKELPSGIYFCNIKGKNINQTSKMLLLR
jgi:flagellar hook assembly protein FlgD